MTSFYQFTERLEDYQREKRVYLHVLDQIEQGVYGSVNFGMNQQNDMTKGMIKKALGDVVQAIDNLRGATNRRT